MKAIAAAMVDHSTTSPPHLQFRPSLSITSSVCPSPRSRTSLSAAVFLLCAYLHLISADDCVNSLFALFPSQQWMDNTGAVPDHRPLSPHNNSDFSSIGGSPPMAHLQAPPMGPSTPSQGSPDDEVIPTAIVIKNIPFNVKRETLLDIIVRVLRFYSSRHIDSLLYLVIIVNSYALCFQLPS
jgi:hypothetical protein